MENQTLIITAVHDRGFAFGVLRDTGEQTFIAPYLALAHDLNEGQHVTANLVPNPKNNGLTPWMAVQLICEPKIGSENVSDTFFEWQTDVLAAKKRQRIDGDEETAPQPMSDLPLDERVFDEILHCDDYLSVGEIADATGEPRVDVGNAAHRLFVAGRIARAEVHNRVGQKRASLLLYAASAARFTGESA